MSLVTSKFLKNELFEKLVEPKVSASDDVIMSPVYNPTLRDKLSKFSTVSEESFSIIEAVAVVVKVEGPLKVPLTSTFV